jgi:hypothetical protein
MGRGIDINSEIVIKPFRLLLKSTIFNRLIKSSDERINEISATLIWNNGISSELTEISENNFQQISKIRVWFLKCS